jgi:Concanavalin A-like lectin/glucanases superfamily
MAIIIGGGINIGGSITISPSGTTPPIGFGMLFEYNAGNSMSYSGSGCGFGDANFNNGPGGYDVNYLYDLNSDLTTATLGNYGVFNSSNNASTYWVSQGLSSYFNFVPADNTYIDSSDANGHTIPGNSSFTYFAMVNVSNFGDNATPTGGIVGGDQSAFGFFPPNTAPFSNPYPLLFACAQQGSISNYVFDYTTQFQPDTWYAVAFTYDATSQTGKLYVNGVNTGTQTNIPPFTNSEPLYWGTLEGFDWLNGKMSVMTTWDRVLTQPEIASYTSSLNAPYQTIPLQTYSQLFDTPGQHDFIVPVGVTNISIVAVGAGGSGTQSAYSAPGQLSGLFDPSTTVTAQTTLVSNTQIQVDGTTYPGILNVTTDYMVAGLDINNTYPNVVPAALLVVSSIDTTDPGNVLITLSKPINTTSIGDEFTFTKALVAADGGYENNDSGYDNGNGGPGPRALPLVYNGGGGRGGVVDYIQSWGLGGGGAGGYGVNDPIVAFDPNQTRINDGSGDNNTGVANVVLELSNSNLTVAATANTTSSGIATGTYEIQNGDQVMFSLTVDAVSGPSGSGIGFGNYNANIAGFVGYDINSGAFYNDGNFYTGGHVDSSGYPTFTTGDIVDIAIADTGFGTSQLLWIRVNGGDWNGSNIANPATATNGVGITLYNPIYLMTSQGDNTSIGQWSINTSHTYSLPAGYTFITGSGDAGATGGDGSMDELYTAKEGQGIAGSGAGGAGRYDDSGAGGGGVGLYGSGSAGTLGVWASGDDLNNDYTGSIGTGGRGGSRRGQSGTQGGQATAWNGGFGGWPGGGGGSATGYYDSGMGGALAFSNNISVTPGHTYNVYVGRGGVGVDNGGSGANGAVRVIWPGSTREFPHTAGSDPAGPSSITIGTEDFTNSFNNGITANLSAGYVVSLTANAGSNIVDRYVTLYGIDNNTLAQDITAMFRQAKMATVNTLTYNGATPDINQFNAYIFNVTWADNSTGKVRMQWNSQFGEIILSIIDTSYTDWQSANPANVGNPNPVLGGTFSFPATFTPYTPLIESNGTLWC